MEITPPQSRFVYFFSFVLPLIAIAGNLTGGWFAFSGFIAALKTRMDGFEIGNIRETVKLIGEELSMPIEVVECALKYIEDSDVR